MPEKKRKILAAALFALCLLCLIIFGCIFIAQNIFLYTNLVSAQDRDFARSLLDRAGVARENADYLFELVDEFYRMPYEGISGGGFERGCIPFFSYSDRDAARHLDQQPDNSLTCRMGAFIVLRDKITFSGAERAAKEKDPKSRRCLTDEKDLLHYDLLFANVVRNCPWTCTSASARPERNRA